METYFRCFPRQTDRQNGVSYPIWGKMPQMLQVIEQNVQCIGIVYFQGVVSMVPNTSLAPTLQDIATALSFPSELDVKIQFLKTLHTLTIGHGKNQADIDLEASTLLPIFHSPGKCHHSVERKKVINGLNQLWTLRTTIMTGLIRYTYFCKSGMKFVGGTSTWTVVKAHSTR